MTVILDASALLAVIKEERGASVVLAPGQHYHMSAVNYGEVLTKIVELGGTIEDVVSLIAPMASASGVSTRCKPQRWHGCGR